MATRPATILDVLGAATYRWYDTRHSGNTLSGGAFSQLVDKSGNNVPLVATSGRLPPSALINNQPAMQFNGGQKLTCPVALNNATVTVFQVVKISSANGGRSGSFAIRNPVSYDAQKGVAILLNGTQPAVYRDSPNYTDLRGPATQPGGSVVAWQVPNPNRIYTDNVGDTANWGPASTGVTADTFGIGNNAADDQWDWLSNAVVGETVIAIGALTLTQIQDAVGVLEWSWGLQANLPSNDRNKAVAPQVTVSDTAKARRRPIILLS